MTFLSSDLGASHALTVLQPLQWLAHAELQNYRTTCTELFNSTLSTPCPSNGASSVFYRMLLMDLSS